MTLGINRAKSINFTLTDPDLVCLLPALYCPRKSFFKNNTITLGGVEGNTPLRMGTLH